MKKVIIIVSCILFVSAIFIVCVKGAQIWTGNNVYDEDTINNGVTADKYWNVTPDQIVKINKPGSAYSFTDITSYSAYVSNNVEYIGNYITKSFYWYNFSRLLYVKMFKVTPGQEVSFVFSSSYYAYCAEFNKNYYLVNDGKWITTGEKVTLNTSTNWIMIVFRQDNGDPLNGSGTNTTICSEEIQDQKLKYIIFRPFTYTFNTNGGTYNNYSDTFNIERLGVEQIVLPVPIKNGYEFTGWKSSSGNIYSGTLGKVYNTDLFCDQTFTAQWKLIDVNVNFMNNSIVMEPGEIYEASINVDTKDGTKYSLSYYSDNNKIASVDNNGNITAVSEGVVNIHVKSNTGSTNLIKVYVMSYKILIPACIEPDIIYKIKVDINNNGDNESINRRNIVISLNYISELNRIGDNNTFYKINMKKISDGEVVEQKETLIETKVSTSEEIMISTACPVLKPGDYSGNIQFGIDLSY